MQHGLGPLSELIVHYPELSLGRGQFAERAGQSGVAYQDLDALGLQQIPRVIDDSLVVGAENALQRSSSASHFAAQMKSFSDRPPMACVQYSTLHLL